MSILKTCSDGWIISHQDYMKIDIVADELNQKCEVQSLRLNPEIFQINSPFKRTKVKKLKGRSKIASNTEALDDGNRLSNSNSEPNSELQLDETTMTIKDLSCTIIQEGRSSGIFVDVPESQKCDNNLAARKQANDFYETVKNFQKYPRFCTTNEEDVAFKTILFDSAGSFHNFICPPKSVLYSDSIEIVNSLVLKKQKYSLIVMDPPWRNKYIRRRKRKQLEAGYSMMETCDIGKLPVKELTNDKALIAVWCTNCAKIKENIINNFFPSWGVDYITTWYWLKVTREGEPVSPFNLETLNLKQPYETIILGRRNYTTNLIKDVSASQSDEDESLPLKTTKIIVSVPSSIHSHKPPLIEILRPYIFEKELNSSNCCELFSRYAISNCTSIGNEVVKLMHDSLYVV